MNNDVEKELASASVGQAEAAYQENETVKMVSQTPTEAPEAEPAVVAADKEITESHITDIYAEMMESATPEERQRLMKFKRKLGLRDDDAIWLIIFGLNYYSKLYQEVPEAISKNVQEAVQGIPAQLKATVESSMTTLKNTCTEQAYDQINELSEKVADRLGESVVKSAETLADVRRKTALIRPIGYLSLMMFLLCLVCFVAGVSFNGKAWGTSVTDKILLAPAGWILPLATCPLLVMEIFDAWIFIGRKKWLHIIAACSLGFVLAFSLWKIF